MHLELSLGSMAHCPNATAGDSVFFSLPIPMQFCRLIAVLQFYYFFMLMSLLCAENVLYKALLACLHSKYTAQILIIFFRTVIGILRFLILAHCLPFSFLRITCISFSSTLLIILSFLENSLKHFHISEPKKPPVFDQPLQPAATEEGDTLQLSCHVRGSEPIRIQWLKAGREIRASERCSFSFANGVALLELAAVTKSDSGEYVCKASNVAGTDTCRSKVTVKGTVKGRIKARDGNLKQNSILLCFGWSKDTTANNQYILVLCKTMQSVKTVY